MPYPPADILLTISHPHGDAHVTLEVWMKEGPGPRAGVRPTRAVHRVTGENIGLEMVPLAYRNNALSRMLIRLHILKDPWPHVVQRAVTKGVDDGE